MGEMVDSVNPANISANLDGKPALHISVEASADGEAFDLETGNAPASQVAEAAGTRLAAKRWSVAYVNMSSFHDMDQARARAGLSWAGAGSWPAPGLYLWCADPSGLIKDGTWKVPVTPLAVQDRYLGTVDVSTTADNFPAAVAGYIDGPRSAWPADTWARFTQLPQGSGPTPVPAPAPPPPPPPPPAPQEATVLLPVLQEGMTLPAVRSVQTLLGGLAVDGIFGPVTHARVVEYQAGHGLTQDGIVGQHTWGSLLGAPQ